jgi:hypothetical protein
VTKSTSSHTCLNCGNHFTGSYCNQCGEKVYSNHDKSIGHLVEEAFHFLTHFEGSFFHTIKTIVRKPGQFSLDYCNGLRKKYFKPVSLFMLLVVLYLLFPRFTGLNMQLGSLKEDQYDFTWLTVPVIEKKMAARSINFDTLSGKYHKTSAAVSKISLFLLIPLFAVLTFLLYYKKKKMMYDHFVVCTEILSFIIALNFLIIPLIAVVVEKVFKNAQTFAIDDNWIARSLFLLINISFIYLVFRNFFKDPVWLTIIKSIAFFLVSVYVILYLYQSIVFLVTMLFI